MIIMVVKRTKRKKVKDNNVFLSLGLLDGRMEGREVDALGSGNEVIFEGTEVRREGKGKILSRLKVMRLPASFESCIVIATFASPCQKAEEGNSVTEAQDSMSCPLNRSSCQGQLNFLAEEELQPTQSVPRGNRVPAGRFQSWLAVLFEKYNCFT